MERITPQQLSDILVDFLDKFSYQDDVCLSRSDFQALQDYASAFLPHDKRIVAGMSEYAHATFPFLPLEIRQKAVVYDAYQMSVDDLDYEEHDSLDGLCPQLSAQTKIQHPVWQGFFESLPDFLKFYGPYCQTTILRGALEFIQATTVERTLFRGYAGSKFPDYVRRMSAQGPVQGAVCFPEQEFPQKEYLSAIASVEAELEDWVGTVNDLFSFYKESDTAVDRINYPLNVSACTGRALTEVLWETSDIALACKRRMESILDSAGKESVRRRVQEFLTGYVRYHLACDRYRIGELCEKSGDIDLLAYYNMSRRAVGALHGPFVPAHPSHRKRVDSANEMSDTLGVTGKDPWSFAWMWTLFTKVLPFRL
ncbi:terpene cyclase [Penicillium verrucosum]|uniref:terpene cyclase n=1 Tax=Penicillium verrucosum TaxID=60171 RepID=UPI0025453AFC|nr:terpene cyclase [Penicillium verrucosum]KAJ5944429.1 terpene cyclase [Penicillium verrucosum]